MEAFLDLEKKEEDDILVSMLKKRANSSPDELDIRLPGGIKLKKCAKPRKKHKNNMNIPSRIPKPISHARVDITIAMQQKIFNKISNVDDNEIRRVCSLPQRSDPWKEARSYRVTGSVCGQAADYSKYGNQDTFVRDFLFKVFKTNKFMRYGTEMEEYGSHHLVRVLRRDVDKGTHLAVPGLIISKSTPYLAYSADGIVLFPGSLRVLYENKCPYSRKPYPRIPKDYKAQVQLGMHILGLDQVYFQMFCGTKTSKPEQDQDTVIELQTRDPQFLRNVLLPRLRQAYLRLLPLFVAKEMGMLRNNQIFLPRYVRVEPFPLQPVDEVKDLPADLQDFSTTRNLIPYGIRN